MESNVYSKFALNIYRQYGILFFEMAYIGKLCSIQRLHKLNILSKVNNNHNTND